MLKRGHRVLLLCPAEAPMHTHAVRLGVPVEVLPIARKNWRGFAALRHWLKAHPNVDVLNTHSSTDSWLAALACATLRPAPPIVRTRHVSTPVNDRAATRWLYQRATRYIVTAGESAAPTTYPRQPFRWRAHHLGPDRDRSRALHPRATAPRRGGGSGSTCNANTSASLPRFETGRGTLICSKPLRNSRPPSPTGTWCLSVTVRNGTTLRNSWASSTSKAACDWSVTAMTWSAGSTPSTSSCCLLTEKKACRNR